MKGFKLTPSYSSLRAASEFSSFKRSAKGFSLKKPSLNFPKSTYLMLRRSHDGFASTSTPPVPPAPVRASVHIPEPLYDDDVICISREYALDSPSADETPPDELQTPSTTRSTPYASSYSSSSSSCHLPPEIDDHSPSLVDGALDEYDPRRGSQLSLISSWVGHHLQDLDLSYGEDRVYEIDIFTTTDDFPSRRDSFILPPGETFQLYQRKRNLPVVPAIQNSRLSRPLPCTPRPGSQLRPIRPLPPPPSPC